MTGIFCFVTHAFGSKWKKPTLFKAFIVSDTYSVNEKTCVTKFTWREHTATTFILINI